MLLTPAAPTGTWRWPFVRLRSAPAQPPRSLMLSILNDTGREFHIPFDLFALVRCMEKASNK